MARLGRDGWLWLLWYFTALTLGAVPWAIGAVVWFIDWVVSGTLMTVAALLMNPFEQARQYNPRGVIAGVRAWMDAPDEDRARAMRKAYARYATSLRPPDGLTVEEREEWLRHMGRRHRG